MLSSKLQKLLLGICLLLIVDIIWVASSELTKYLYQDESYDKPFFCTYFKTSMFTLYLLVIGLISPWKESCVRSSGGGSAGGGRNYTIMDQSAEDDNYYASHNALSNSSFVPIRSPKDESISGTESDDSSIRSVRFSKMAEVREMSAHEATDALMSRLSYSASLRIYRQKTHHKTARTALMFCILWFLANYLFQLSLELSETAMVTLISSTSSFFILLLAAFYPSASGDKLTYSKLLVVLINFSGVILVTISDIKESKFSRGIILALLSAFFYAAYLVFVKRKSDTEEKIDIPLFFGFVGLFNLLLLWPIFFILNLLQIETFELPTQKQFAILFLNGFIGTVLSEALWLWGCFLTSSLVGTLAMSLQIPLSMLLDFLIRKKIYSPLFYFGSIPIFLALIFVALLIKNDDSDPILKFLKLCHWRLFRCRRSNIVRINDEDHLDQQSLINNQD